MSFENTIVTTFMSFFKSLINGFLMLAPQNLTNTCKALFQCARHNWLTYLIALSGSETQNNSSLNIKGDYFWPYSLATSSLGWHNSFIMSGTQSPSSFLHIFGWLFLLVEDSTYHTYIEDSKMEKGEWKMSFPCKGMIPKLHISLLPTCNWLQLSHMAPSRCKTRKCRHYSWKPGTQLNIRISTTIHKRRRDFEG